MGEAYGTTVETVGVAESRQTGWPACRRMVVHVIAETLVPLVLVWKWSVSVYKRACNTIERNGQQMIVKTW